MQGFHTRAGLLFFGILCAGVYCIGLGTIPLIDPDEPIYGQFIKEMLVGGDWLTPHYNGTLWFDKPPLYYWLATATAKLIGLHEFSIRFPSAMCAALLVLCVYLLTRYDFGHRAGLFSALVMASCIMQLVMSHAAATDALMVVCLTASLYAYRRWLDTEGHHRLYWMAGCGVLVGLGMLAKGPVVPILAALIIVLHLLWLRKITRLFAVDILVGIAVASVVGLPWYLAMYLLYGDAFMQGFIIQNNITRFLSPLHKSQHTAWYGSLRNLLSFLLFFLPWTPFLPQAIQRAWRKGPGQSLALIWCLVIILFFSLSQTQNFTYTYPAMPAAAILVGLLMSAVVAEDMPLQRTLGRGLILAGVISVILGVATVSVASRQFPGETGHLLWAFGLLTGAVVLACWLWKRRSFTAAIAGIAGGMTAFIVTILLLVMPALAHRYASKDLANRISRTRSRQVIVFDLHRPGLLYYLPQPPVITADAEMAHRLIVAEPSTAVVCKKGHERQIKGVKFRQIYREHRLAILTVLPPQK